MRCFIELFRKQVVFWLLILPLFSAHGADVQLSNVHLYKEGSASDVGVILRHGRGQDPDWLVVGPLRYGLNEKLGVHTVSLQMPGGRKMPFQAYGGLFEDAYERIEEGISFLRAKGVKRIYLIGHSMGARMASAYLALRGNPAIVGFVAIGAWSGGGDIFNSTRHIAQLRIPALDVYGTAEAEDVNNATAREELTRRPPDYQQLPIHAANHQMEGKEEELIRGVAAWIQAQDKKHSSEVR